ncbi:amidohydrolase family protein, partial [Arsukibacterium sp.]|uniref:amidohydrolase family protein n=1 Tax=Arsukibacterium sp. TaxID=1977258 RepID=UPI00299E1A5D
FIIPTITVMEGMLGGRINDELLLQAPPAWLKPAAINSLTERFSHAAIPTDRFQLLNANTKLMADAGILLLAGSDAPNPNTAHGVSLIVEMVLLQRAGVPLLQVLQSATSAPAQAFALNEVGYLRPGYKADMLLLNDNPMTDLTTLLAPAAIWKNGWRHQPSLPVANKAVVSGLIADFTADLSARSGSFSASSDSMMQGKSSAAISVQHGVLQVTGASRPGFAYPWAGVAWQTGDNIEQGSNLSAVNTVRFTIRGTPGEYRLAAFSAGSFMPVSQRFAVTADWQTVELPLSAFNGLNTQAVSMLLWNGPAGEFSFELDDIVLE